MSLSKAVTVFLWACAIPVVFALVMIVRHALKDDSVPEAPYLATLEEVRGRAASLGCKLGPSPSDRHDGHSERCEAVLDPCGCVLSFSAHGRRLRESRTVVVEEVQLTLRDCPDSPSNRARDALLLPLVRPEMHGRLMTFIANPVGLRDREVFSAGRTRMFGTTYTKVHLGPGEDRYTREVTLYAAEHSYREIEDITRATLPARQPCPETAPVP